VRRLAQEQTTRLLIAELMRPYLPQLARCLALAVNAIERALSAQQDWLEDHFALRRSGARKRCATTNPLDGGLTTSSLVYTGSHREVQVEIRDEVHEERSYLDCCTQARPASPRLLGVSKAAPSMVG
jgi:hypothetical protein